jgi:hypothetical protein
VARDRAVRIAFNRPLDPASVSAEGLYLIDSWGETLSGLMALAPAGDTLIWQPEAPYWFATACTVHATAVLRDTAGAVLDQDAATEPPIYEPFRAWFETLAQPEGPRVIASTPADGATAVERDVVIAMTFSEALDPLSATSTAVRVLRDGSVGIPGTIRVESGDTLITFTPHSALEAGRSYTLQVRGELSSGPGGITDPQGHRLDQDREARGYQPYSATFRVEAPLHLTQLAFSPAGPDTFVDRAASLALTFSDTLDAGTTDASIGLARAGEPVAAQLILDPALPGARLTPASPLAPLGRYQVWIDTLLAATDGSLFDADPLTSGRQRYTFDFSAEPESLHPRVLEIYPAADAPAAAVTDSVAVIFSSPVDPATVTTASFVLTALATRGRADPVPATVIADTLSAQLIPNDSLAFATEYEVTIATSVTGRHGLYGLDQDAASAGLQAFTSRFTTDRDRVPPQVIAALPDSAATGVGRGTLIALTFSEPVVEASVAGAFALLAADTMVAGSGSLDAGGRHWTYEPAESLAYATTYVVQVDTTAQDAWGNGLDQRPETPAADPFRIEFVTEQERVPPWVLAHTPAAGDSAILVTAAVELAFSEPLAAASLTSEAVRVSAGETPLAGTLSLGAGDSVLTWLPAGAPEATLAFGTTHCVRVDTLLTDLAGNRFDQHPATPERDAYSFCFTTELEQVSPTVLALLPGLIDVPIDAQPQIVFSEALDPLSLAPEGVVTLTLAGSVPVAFGQTLSASGDTLTLMPEELFFPEGAYTVRIDTLATDLAGNRLDGDTLLAGRQRYSETFVAAEDLTAPEVLGVIPVDGATHVAPDAVVSVIFSERLLAGTVTQSTIYLLPPTGPAVPLAGDGEPQLDSSLTVVTLQPADSLAEGASYSVNVTSAVTDLARNPLEDPMATLFTVNQSPVVVWTPGLCATGAGASVAFDASASSDPDTDDEILWAIWDWGDGTRDSLAAPAGLVAEHAYACQDTAGCDGLDNDGDGAIDESTGPGACDESYQIELILQDPHGARSRAAGGVSFCAFLVRGSDPAPEDTVAADDTVRIALTRPVSAASLDTAIVFLQLPDSSAVGFTAELDNGGTHLLLLPDAPLGPGDYAVVVTPGLADTADTRLDQQPCEVGEQAFELRFYGPAARRRTTR